MVTLTLLFIFAYFQITDPWHSTFERVLDAAITASIMQWAFYYVSSHIGGL